MPYAQQPIHIFDKNTALYTSVFILKIPQISPLKVSLTEIWRMYMTWITRLLGFVLLVYKIEYKAMHSKGTEKSKADCLRVCKKCNE